MKTEQYIQSLNTYIGQLKAHVIYLEQLGAPAFFELDIDCTALNEDFNCADAGVFTCITNYKRLTI